MANSHYCGVFFEDNDSLRDWFSNVELDFSVKNEDIEFREIEIDSPHITICYLIGDLEDKSVFYKACVDSRPLGKITLNFVGFELFCKDKDCLVARFESKELSEWNDGIVKSCGGLTPTFKNYKPHMTIGYFNGGTSDMTLPSVAGNFILNVDRVECSISLHDEEMD